MKSSYESEWSICEKSGAFVRIQREYESQCEKGIGKEGVSWEVGKIVTHTNFRGCGKGINGIKNAQIDS